MATVRQFPELIIDMIISLLRDNLVSEIDKMISDRDFCYDDSERIHLDSNFKFFISEENDPIETPSCFVICEDIQFTSEEKQPNYVSGKAMIGVNVVDSDRTSEMTKRKSYRYGGILHSILHQKTITSNNSGIVASIIVEREGFGRVYKKEGPQGTFCGEVGLDLSVEFWQNL